MRLPSIHCVAQACKRIALTFLGAAALHLLASGLASAVEHTSMDVRLSGTLPKSAQLEAQFAPSSSGGDGEIGDEFSRALAIEGEVAMVGAPLDGITRPEEGSVYVYARVGGVWVLQDKLVAPDAAQSLIGARFGSAVALLNGVAVVGAPNDGAQSHGAAYVFTRVGNSWEFTTKLLPDTTAGQPASIQFGAAVALNTNRVVVGAPHYRGAMAFGARQGTAYVFELASGVATQVARLEQPAGDARGVEYFGNALAIDQDRILVGSRSDRVGTNNGQGSAFLFELVAGIWTTTNKFVASDGLAGAGLATSVAFEGNVVLLGAPEQRAAYLFTQVGAVWSEAKLVPPDDGFRFGSAVDLQGQTALVGARSDTQGTVPGIPFGSAYVYVEETGIWSFRSKLVAQDAASDDFFGHTVALSADVAMVGRIGRFRARGNQGAVYAFTRAESGWSDHQIIDTGDGARAHWMGSAVASDGDSALVGAPGDGAGSAYFLSRDPSGGWIQEKIVAPAGAREFGSAVALAGDLALIGAPASDVGRGFVFAYRRQGGVWLELPRLTAPDGSFDERFGDAVALHGNTAVIGRPGRIRAGQQLGAADVFAFTDNWAHQITLVAPGDPDPDSKFGNAVAVYANTVLVGAPQAGADNSGGAFVFEQSGGVWSAGVAAPLPLSGFAEFGFAVAIEAETAIVSAPRQAVTGAPEAGQVYLLQHTAAGWQAAGSLLPPAPVATQLFGRSLSLRGDTILVGDRDSAHVYRRPQGSWLHRSTLQAGSSPLAHAFATSLAVAAGRYFIGAPLESGTPPFGNPEEGRAHLFFESAPAAANDAYGAYQGVELTGDVSLNDALGADAPGAYAIVAAPLHGALVLSEAGSFSYQSDSEFSGSDSFTYELRDGDGDASRAVVSIDVTAAPPIALDGEVTTLEDQSVTFNLRASAPAGADLQFSLVTAPTRGEAVLLDAASGEVRYTPAAGITGADSFTFSVRAGTQQSGIATISINTTAVNDAPTFLPGPEISVLEDAGEQHLPAWASALSDGDAESDQALTFIVSSNSNPALFAVTPSVDASTGALSFAPASNTVGRAQLTLTLRDDGGTANGGLDTSSPATLTIVVEPVNDGPTFTIANPPPASLEDAGLQRIAAFAASIDDGDAERTQAFTFVVDSNSNAALFSIPPAIDAATGELSYQAAIDTNGSAEISVRLVDDGGGANGGTASSVAQTFTIAVSPVNDAPTFEPGQDQHVAPNSGETVQSWATQLRTGPADESTQSLHFDTSANSNPALFHVAPAIDAYGRLSFTPFPNRSGSASILIHAKDNGGISDGGVDTSPGHLLTISVEPDTQGPVIVSITRSDASPATSSPVRFDVAFDEPIVGLDLTDLRLRTTGSVSGANLISLIGQGDVARATVRFDSGTGTLGLDIVDDDSIRDASGNPLAGSGPGNGNFAGDTYAIDLEATDDVLAPSIAAIERLDSDPSAGPSVRFLVSFSEEVLGVDGSDFDVIRTGALVGASDQVLIAGSGMSYVVTVETGHGVGTVRLDLVDDDSIRDAADNPLGGPGSGNGSFVSGPHYRIDATQPEALFGDGFELP